MHREQLVSAIFRKRSFLCIGLDTEIGKIPRHLRAAPDPVLAFNQAIIDATRDLCVAYKPNLAFYEALGPSGWLTLQKTVEYIGSEHFIIADAKRGDIGNTSRMYAEAFFNQLHFDACTIAPYMGADSVTPFLGFPGKWAILLALTSNGGSADFQQSPLAMTGEPLWEEVLRRAQGWGSPDNLMFVVGATHPAAFARVRETGAGSLPAGARRGRTGGRSGHHLPLWPDQRWRPAGECFAQYFIRFGGGRFCGKGPSRSRANTDGDGRVVKELNALLQSRPMHEAFLRRCFDLARLGAGSVSPNPMVGAVLVHEGRIIGEGYHQRYGEAHAEVNCIQSVATDNQIFIPHSTLYCSLEPCFHFGKTPPCVNLVLAQKNPARSSQQYRSQPPGGGPGAGKTTGSRRGSHHWSAGNGRPLAQSRFLYLDHQHRPYIILKWAQSRDGYLGRAGERTAISGPAVQRLVHRWRSEVDAILVGATTARVDNPRLDNRLFFGKSPLRLAFDIGGRLPATAHLLDDALPTWIFGPPRRGRWRRTQFFPTAEKVKIPDLLEQLRAANCAILLVEGGSQVLHQWLAEGWWDEIRVVENERGLGEGVAAPNIPASGGFTGQLLGGRG